MGRLVVVVIIIMGALMSLAVRPTGPAGEQPPAGAASCLLGDGTACRLVVQQLCSRHAAGCRHAAVMQQLRSSSRSSLRQRLSSRLGQQRGIRLWQQVVQQWHVLLTKGWRRRLGWKFCSTFAAPLQQLCGGYAAITAAAAAGGMRRGVLPDRFCRRGVGFVRLQVRSRRRISFTAGRCDCRRVFEAWCQGLAHYSSPALSAVHL